MVEYDPIPFPIYISLWISMLVYVPISLTYFFASHVTSFSSPPWATNQWVRQMYQMFQSGMGVGLMVLGYVCVDAILKGTISTIEVEIELITVSLYAGLVIKYSMPPPLAYIVPFTKPEVYLTVLLWFTAGPYARWQAYFIAGGSLIYNTGHLFMYPMFQPFTIDKLLEEVAAAPDPDTLEKLKKYVGTAVGEASPRKDGIDTEMM